MLPSNSQNIQNPTYNFSNRDSDKKSPLNQCKVQKNKKIYIFQNKFGTFFKCF